MSEIVPLVERKDIQKFSTCPTCNGNGLVEKMGLRGVKIKTCPTCEGSGRV